VHLVSSYYGDRSGIVEKASARKRVVLCSVCWSPKEANYEGVIGYGTVAAHHEDECRSLNGKTASAQRIGITLRDGPAAMIGTGTIMNGPPHLSAHTIPPRFTVKSNFF
jgi:hypothetical protein